MDQITHWAGKTTADFERSLPVLLLGMAYLLGPKVGKVGDPKVGEVGDPKVGEVGDPKVGEVGDPKVGKGASPEVGTSVFLFFLSTSLLFHIFNR